MYADSKLEKQPVCPPDQQTGVCRGRRRSRKPDTETRLTPIVMCGSTVVSNGQHCQPVDESPQNQTCPQNDLVARLICVRKKAANAMGMADLKLSPRGRRPEWVQPPLGEWVDRFAQRFNDVFMAIQGYTSVLMRRIDAGHAHRQQLGRIESLVDAESVLTNDLLFNLIRARSEQNHALERFLINEILSVADCRTAGIHRPVSDGRVTECAVAVMIRILGEVSEQTVSLIKDAEGDAHVTAKLRQILAYVDAGLNSVQTALAEAALDS